MRLLTHKRKLLLPVIHVQAEAQARRNVAIAVQAGCDGAFLINHETTDGKRPLLAPDLLTIHAACAARFPTFWLGVNCLDLPAAELFAHVTPAVGGVWADNAEIDERQEPQPAATAIQKAHAASGWQGLYFGGVAFKYQRPVQDVAQAAKMAAPWMDVVTTSGAATGEAAGVEKVRVMKQAVGKRPLALASGVTVANVERFLPFVDIFLVATGISRSFYELDPRKTTQLANNIHTAPSGLSASIP